jgi:hypothetical protein
MPIAEKIDQRKTRWLNLYDPAQPGAAVFLIRYLPDLPARPWPHLSNAAERVEWAWQKYTRMLEQVDWLDDDSLPFLDLYTGTEVFASAFGCPTYYPAGDMPFTMPRIRAAEEVDAVDMPGLDAPPIANLFEMAEELRRRAGPDALMHLVDVQSPLDICAQIWDKTTFYPALLQEPQAVLALAEKARAFLTLFLDAWFSRFGRDFIAHYPDCYMPQGITLSVDEVGAVSGKVFNNLFLPELVALSERYGGMGVRCSARARHQWTNFLKIPDLQWLSLAQPPEDTRAAYDFFAGSVAQFHDYQGQGDPREWPGQRPPQARCVYEINASTRDEARSLVNAFRALKR